MERNEQWMQEVEKRMNSYFDYLGDKYLTREIYEWNKAFMDEYHRLNDWTSEDGTMQYTRDNVEKMLGIPEPFGYWFVSHVRRQIIAYREKRLEEMIWAGYDVSDIVAELDMTPASVMRMRERLNV